MSCIHTYVYVCVCIILYARAHSYTYMPIYTHMHVHAQNIASYITTYVMLNSIIIDIYVLQIQ